MKGLRKTKKVKYCANCLRPIKDCTCSSHVIEIGEECKNCSNGVGEEDNYCSICGFKL